MRRPAPHRRCRLGSAGRLQIRWHDSQQHLKSDVHAALAVAVGAKGLAAVLVGVAVEAHLAGANRAGGACVDLPKGFAWELLVRKLKVYPQPN